MKRTLMAIGLLLAATTAFAQTRSVFTEDLTWMEIRDAIAAGKSTAIVYAGGIEQNGPHMILGKHDQIVAWTAERIASELGHTLVAPVVSYVPEGDYAPPTLLALASRLMMGVATKTIDLVVTNVPGPQFPLYLLGGKMSEVAPFVGLMGELTIGVAVLSYDGELNFGLTGDWDVCPDLDVLAEGIEKSLYVLADAVDADPD